MRRLVAVLLFLTIVNEGDPTTLYRDYLFAPFEWVQGVLFDPLPIKIRPFDLLILISLLAAPAHRPSRTVRPVRNAMLLAVGTVVLWFVFGVVTGGDARAASWQTYLLLSSVLMAFSVAANFRTAEHYALLGKAVVAAGIYRAAMSWWFNFAYLMPLRLPSLPEYVAAHDDSVVWVVSVMLMLLNAVAARRTSATMRAIFVITLLCGAIQFNNRRLAWVALVIASGTAFFLLPDGPVRKRVVRIVKIAAPIVALYVVVGWGRSERIFLPLQSISSVSTDEDQSTLARNAENLGLVATIRDSNLITGTGWGHGYIELTSKYSIARFFELWPYVPHNSILGLLAYTGVLGFMGYWLMFPTALFMNARTAKLGSTEQYRRVGFAAVIAMVVCSLQMYGDMGIFSLRTMYTLAVAEAAALRMPIAAQAWGRPLKTTTPHQS